MSHRGERRRCSGLLCGLCVIAIAMVGSPSGAFAEAGQLDPTFGARGKTISALDFGEPRFWYDVKVQATLAPGGRILVSGDNLVLRYLSNGHLDTTFGEGGSLRIENVQGRSFTLAALKVDPKGRIVVVGTTETSPGTQAAILRFGPNGAPDPDFGGGDGIVVTDFGIRPLPDGSNGSVEKVSLSATGVDVDANGRIVVSGSALRAAFYCAEFGAYVGRLDPQGNVDPSFGDGGVVVYEASSMHSADGLTLDSLGAPLFFGWDGYCHGDSGEHPILVDRLDASGSPSPAFGKEGQVTVDDYPRAIAFDPSGRILILEATDVQRLLPSGALDRSFGSSGTTTILLPGNRSGLSDLETARNGSVILVGTEARYFRRADRAAPRRRLVVARLGPRGVLDQRFGREGLVNAARFGRHSNAVGRRVLLDGKGHAIVAGTVRDRQLSTGQGLALYRFDLR